MGFEFIFLLIALIDNREPLTINKYAQMSECQFAAKNLTDYVDDNYTDLKYNIEPVKELFLKKLATFGLKRETLNFPFPLKSEREKPIDEWVPKILEEILIAQEYGVTLDVPELRKEAQELKIIAEEMLENSDRYVTPKENPPLFLISKDNIAYVCMAAPK